jgi:signal transduction histidine kinase
MRFPLRRVLLAVLLFVTANAWAADQATPEDAKAMAVKAADLLRSAGADKAFAAFDDKAGPWHDRDLYVTVIDAEGKTVAHGNNPGLIGKSAINLKDVDGKPFVREFLAIKDAGWVDYKWQDPMTKAVEAKTSYEIRVGDYLVGVGAYKH